MGFPLVKRVGWKSQEGHGGYLGRAQYDSAQLGGRIGGLSGECPKRLLALGSSCSLLASKGLRLPRPAQRLFSLQWAALPCRPLCSLSSWARNCRLRLLLRPVGMGAAEETPWARQDAAAVLQ